MVGTDTKREINIEKAKGSRFSLVLNIIKNFREINLILIIIVVCILMTILSPVFMTWDNISSVLMSFATDGIVVIGMTLILIVGGIDLSVASVTAFAGVLAGKMFLGGDESMVGKHYYTGCLCLYWICNELLCYKSKAVSVYYNNGRNDYSKRSLFRN